MYISVNIDSPENTRPQKIQSRFIVITCYQWMDHSWLYDTVTKWNYIYPIIGTGCKILLIH